MECIILRLLHCEIIAECCKCLYFAQTPSSMCVSGFARASRAAWLHLLSNYIIQVGGASSSSGAASSSGAGSMLGSSAKYGSGAECLQSSQVHKSQTMLVSVMCRTSPEQFVAYGWANIGWHIMH